MSNILTFFKKNLKIILSIVSIIIVLSIILYLFYIPFKNNKPVTTIKNNWSEKPLINERYKPSQGFEKDNELYDYDFVLTEFNFFRPKYSFISQFKEVKQLPANQQYIGIKVIQLKRNNLWNWKVTDYRNNQITGLSFQETLDLVSKYDITTDFPGKENYDIINYEPLTEAEIKRNQEKLERERQREKEMQELQSEFDKLSPEEKIKYFEQEKQKYIDNKEEMLKQMSEEMFNEAIKAIDQQIQEIKEENNLN